MCSGAQRARRLQRLPEEKPGEHQGYTAESLLGNTARSSLRREGCPRIQQVSGQHGAQLAKNCKAELRFWRGPHSYPGIVDGEMRFNQSPVANDRGKTGMLISFTISPMSDLTKL